MKSQSPLKFAFRYLKEYKARLAFAILCSIIFVIVPMQVPILTGALIDGITGNKVKIYGYLLDQSPEQILIFAIVGLMIIAAAYGISAYFRTTSIAKVSRHFVSELRKALIQKLELMSLDFHGKYGSGELLSRVILDTQSTRQFVESVFIRTIINIVRVIYPASMLLLINPFLAAVASSILPFQWVLTRNLQKRLHHATAESRTTRAQLTTAVKENLDGIETIKTSNAEISSANKMSEQAEELEFAELRTNKYSAMIRASVWTLTYIGFALTWWLGGLMVLDGDMTIGTLIVFTGFVAFLYTPFRKFSDVVKVYQKGIVGLERIQEILDNPSTVQDSPDATPLKVKAGKIEFRNASSSYAQHEVLTGINLTIEANGITAVVGKSGSGKSTLLKLIARLYDPTEGQILIDGQDIKKVTLKSLRSQIAVIPQIPIIFSGTVSENIRLGNPDASDKEVEETCQAADAIEFIDNLSEGLNTRLGQGGVNLSGGEAQRIAIARAILRKPKILLLDEPTSALDSESKSSIMATIDQLKKSMTIILVGHHLKAISKADRVIVMDDGKIVEDGTHKELLSSPSLYSFLYSQDGA